LFEAPEVFVMPPVFAQLQSQFVEPRPVTDRVQRLRDEYFTYRPVICLERALSYTRSYRETGGLAVALRRAYAFRRVCEEKSVTILDDELIVGMPAGQPRAGVFCPEISWGWLEDELDTIATREQDPYGITEDQKATFREEIAPYWRGHSMEEYFLANLPEDTRAIAVETGIIDVEIKSQSGPGEFSPGYANILLKKGLKGVAASASESLAGLDPADPGDYGKIDFLESVLIVVEGAHRLAERYADEADRLAEGADGERAAELRHIAEVCRRVPFEPPATFHEALQSIWFGQVLLFIEENAPSYSPGRMDQYLNEFLKRDLGEGRLTALEAQELIECFWIKTAGMTWLLNENCSKYFAGYMPFQNINVGGRTPTGDDGTNDLSYMMVQASMDLRLFQPSLSAFIHDGTPPEFLRHICKLVRLGTGFPALHGEATTIEMMRNKGVAEDELMEYCMVGCVEPNIHGKMSQWSDGGHYNFGAAVQLALDDGISWQDGRRLGAPTGPTESIESFDALKDAVKAQLSHFIEHIARANMIIQVGHSLYLPKPFSSALVEGCVESGRDMADGGAKYNAGPAFIGTGIADLADSLTAVRHLVFEDHELTLPELADVLRADFEGHEDIRQMLVTRAPKYGNDIDEVDDLAREFSDYVADVIDGYTGFTGSRIINGLYPVSSHVPHGRVVGALPSGRRAWKPLADGCSACHGQDTVGPTAVVKSVAKIDHARHTAGTLLNIKLNPELLTEDRDLDNLAALIKSFFLLGGYHIQFNVVTGDTLRAAQADPDEYRGLLVRVAGYSAYFTDLCREMQDDIIDRTEHCTWGA
jgi:pyruvate formate-lyase/glycerol dehydratase family glycyl radical enzyme